jgi:hypothetical protein
MILYHWTHVEHLAAIAEHGLLPHLPDPHYLTLDKPVVWLTTAADEWSGHRLTARLQPNSKRLVNYATWLRGQHATMVGDSGKTWTSVDIAALMTPERQANWYVYFGTIPPDKIEGLP